MKSDVFDDRLRSFNMWCDRVILFWLYLGVFVLPATTAGIEIAASGAILAYLVKKTGNLMACRGIKNSAERSRAQWTVLCAPHPSGNISLPLALWTFISFGSIFVSWYPAASVSGFIGKTLEAVFLFLCVREVMVTEKRLRWFVWVFLASGFILCLDGFWQIATGFDIFKHIPYEEGRMSASLKHPNNLGGYLVAVIPPALYQTWRVCDIARRTKKIGRSVLIVVMVIVTAVILFSMGLTMSRGAWVGMFAGFVFMAVTEKRIRWLVVACGLAFLIIFMPVLIQDRNYFVFTPPIPVTTPVAPSASGEAVMPSVSETPLWQGTGRETFWGDALRIIRDHPLTGTGLNTYTQAIKRYSRYWQNYPHNCYLQMGAEIGIIGVSVFFWFVFALLGLVIDKQRKIRDARVRGLLIALGGSWTGLLVESALDTTLYSSQLDALFWIIAGLCAVLALAVNRPGFSRAR